MFKKFAEFLNKSIVAFIVYGLSLVFSLCLYPIAVAHDLLKSFKDCALESIAWISTYLPKPLLDILKSKIEKKDNSDPLKDNADTVKVVEPAKPIEPMKIAALCVFIILATPLVIINTTTLFIHKSIFMPFIDLYDAVCFAKHNADNAYPRTTPTSDNGADKTAAVAPSYYETPYRSEFFYLIKTDKYHNKTVLIEDSNLEKTTSDTATTKPSLA